MKKILLSTLLAGAAFAVTPANAVVKVPVAVPSDNLCSITSTVPTAVDCYGYVDKNQINDSAEGLLTQTAALRDLGLLGASDVFTKTMFDAAEKIQFGSAQYGQDGSGKGLIDFDKPLFGDTYVGFHFGAGNGGPGNKTVFYKLFFAQETDTFLLNFTGAFSNGILYGTGNPPPAVPEPATWAMMLMGFGAVGYAMRRRTVNVSFA